MFLILTLMLENEGKQKVGKTLWKFARGENTYV